MKALLQPLAHMVQNPRLTLAAVALFALGLVVAAFVLEHGFGVAPCQMCWWQRYVHWGMLGVATVGVMLPRAFKLWAFLLAALALVGLYIAVWQSGAQVGLWAFPASCTGWGQTLATDAGSLLDAMARTTVVPCDKEQFKLMGLTLAMWNIPAMVGVLVASVALARSR